MCDLGTSRIGASYIYIYIYIYDTSSLRLNDLTPILLRVNIRKCVLTVYLCVLYGSLKKK